MKALLASALVAATALSAAPLQAQDRIEVGRLECSVEGGVGLIIGSSRDAVCTFFPAAEDGMVDTYVGTVNRIGLDIGITDESVIQWLVFAPTSDLAPGALAGQYVGVGGEATVGVGLGANALLGGSEDTIALQPVSIQGQTGLNVAVGITGFQLESTL